MFPRPMGLRVEFSDRQNFKVKEFNFIIENTQKLSPLALCYQYNGDAISANRDQLYQGPKIALLPATTALS